MKNLTTDPASQNRLTLRGQFNEVINLEPLQSFIAYLAAQFKRVVELDGDMAKVWRLSRLRTKAARKLQSAKVHNFKTGLKWTMLRRPAWRRKVLESLGGDAALTAWDRRAAKAAARVPGPYKARAYKRPPLAALRLGMIELPTIRDAFDVKTDDSGAFRLAPIPNARPQRPFDYEAPELTETQKWERKEGWRLRADLRAKQASTEPVDESELKGYWYKDEAANTIYRIAPIPLLPSELRGNWNEDSVPEDNHKNSDIREVCLIESSLRLAPIDHDRRSIEAKNIDEKRKDNANEDSPP